MRMIALLVAMGLLSGLLIYLVVWGVILRPGRQKTPPNQQKYYEDDALEGRVLTKILGWSLVVTFLSAAVMPAYWLTEPARMSKMAKKWNQQSRERGAIWYEDSKVNPDGFGCTVCHGGLKGGTVRYIIPAGPDAGREVTWTAPALDDVLYRFNRDQLHDILIYGRPNTPMPAWGLRGGGPMNEQMINDVIAYLESVQVSPEQARENAGSGQGLSGSQLFDRNCARCHTQGWSYRYPEVTWDKPVYLGPPGGGAFGPALNDGRTKRQFGSVDEQAKFVSEGSLYGRPYGQNGIGSGRMPAFGQILAPDEIRAIVEYERSL